jgi:hypothetical protein
MQAEHEVAVWTGADQNGNPVAGGVYSGSVETPDPWHVKRALLFMNNEKR